MDFVIAVDGAAASGKGTLAAMLAADYALPHLDTGLLYRGVGCAVLAAGGDPANAAEAEAAAGALDASRLDDPRLQTGPAGEAASQAAAHPGVRDALFQLQRRFAEQAGGAVLDGRDIGTVIAPDAAAKLFIDAALEVRARRRWLQVQVKGDTRPLSAMIDALARRDARDASRATAPMVQAADAVRLDTTDLDIAQVAEAARAIVAEAHARWRGSRG